MASKQMKQMNELYRSIKERVSKPGLDLATNRDIVENLSLAAAEPEAVNYAEVDAGGVPALWCIPHGSDPGPRPVAQPLRWLSRYLDAHRPKGDRAHREGRGRLRARAEPFGLRRNTSSPPKSMTWKRRIAGSSPGVFALRTLPALVTRSAATIAVSLALTLRDKGLHCRLPFCPSHLGTTRR